MRAIALTLVRDASLNYGGLKCLLRQNHDPTSFNQYLTSP
jgi:hypothetical protein